MLRGSLPALDLHHSCQNVQEKMASLASENGSKCGFVLEPVVPRLVHCQLALQHFG